MIDPLLKSTGSRAYRHHDGEAPARPAGDLHSLLHAFTAETGAVFSDRDRKAAASPPGPFPWPMSLTP